MIIKAKERSFIKNNITFIFIDGHYYHLREILILSNSGMMSNLKVDGKNMLCLILMQVLRN